jgi:hypothetical protein
MRARVARARAARAIRLIPSQLFGVLLLRFVSLLFTARLINCAQLIN